MLSIIIPTYNEEKYIGRTLDQLKKLTLPHEIIVTDDKSPDNTTQIARKYTDKVLVPDKKHATIAANRNAGAAIAQGDFFVFIDGDSFIENPDTFFAKALEVFNKNPKILGLTVYLDVLPEMAVGIDWIMFPIINLVHRVKNNILHSGEAVGKFQMIRRDSFKSIGGYRGDLVTREDGDIFLRLSKIGRTYFEPDLIVYHSARRAHSFGWPKLLWIWMMNSFWFAMFKSVVTKEWKPIR